MIQVKNKLNEHFRPQIQDKLTATRRRFNLQELWKNPQDRAQDRICWAFEKKKVCGNKIKSWAWKHFIEVHHNLQVVTTSSCQYGMLNCKLINLTTSSWNYIVFCFCQLALLQVNNSINHQILKKWLVISSTLCNFVMTLATLL